uniref:non-specific serine/threonine protein kinase n=1 Tax=Leersia perrieri TaxID=77586 RepID=A0A0D9XYE6_9ORYZ
MALLCLLLSLFSPATATVPPTASTSSNRSCISDERAALLSIKESFLDPYNRLESWQGEDCCSWWGVRCSNKTGHVIKLRLQGSTDDCLNFYGDKLGGEISYSLVSLQKLRYLDLSCNNFNWSRIPVFLGSLPSLRYLNLSYGFFYGSIPPQLGNLTNLVYLDLKPWPYNSKPCQYLYSVGLSWLSHIPSLKYLDLTCVNLRSAVHWVNEINMLPVLKVLNLKECRLVNSARSLHHSNLTALEKLDISENIFSTRIAPNWFWNVTSLTFLNIAYCSFYGPIPDEIGRITSLEQISLEQNNLNSTMIPSSFKNLCNLKVLDLVSTNTAGDIRELMKRLPNCPSNKLQELGLSANSISGTLPNWSEPLANLTILLFSNNYLTGTIPSSIWALTKLNYLDLRNNMLNGTVTEHHLGNLNNLVYLGLGNNTHLQIKISSNWIPPFKLQIVLLNSLQLGPEFPAWLRSQRSIQHLQISNASISATIPDWFWTVFSRAEFLGLAFNQISGTLPTTLEFMAARTMFLSYNRFTGTVPKFPRNLTSMHMSDNSLSGTLPSDFGAPMLEMLVLHNNSISGTIPSSLCSLKQLYILDLSGNMLTGEVPTCQEDLNPPARALAVINFNSNKLSGEFPLVLQSCPQLVFLDLSYNQFSGSLPLWIGEKYLPYLSLLRLRSNMFSGHIPMELTKIGQLQFLDLAQNKFFGTCVQGAFYDTIISYQPVSVQTKGQQLEFSVQISRVVNLDLSSNNFTGAIPQDIGALVALKSLNFSWNFLNGEIPETIGQLKQLESLDLSHNELSGEIPSSLQALNTLGTMNLSYNDLSGRIPTGNQFGSYDSSSYIGNIGLCGRPLTRDCFRNTSSEDLPGNHGDLEYKSLCLSMAIGFVFSLWVVLCLLLFKTNWRKSYFMFVDRLQKKICVNVKIR